MAVRPVDLKLSENARIVLERRYLAKDQDGKLIETPEDLFRRVAANIARAERAYARTDEADAIEAEWEQRFLDLMTSLSFLPNSPTLGNAGRPMQQLSACFVLPIEDSIEGIFETVKETALIHQSGGGTGFAFSRLRPAGDVVQSTGGVASGPVSFMKVFDGATEAIKQGGTRRGANMAILDVRHPDIEAFINVKADMTTLTNFNISVAVDEAFMRAVHDDAEYDLVNPRTGQAVAKRRAKAVFDQIVANAWANGDPGLVFLDRINRDNPTPKLGAIEATNPCVTGDTWVYTGDGPRQVRDVVNRPVVVVVNGVAYPSGDCGFFKTGTRTALRLKTVEGPQLRLTPDHQLLRIRRQTRYARDVEWVAAQDLKPGDCVVLGDHRDACGWAGPHTEEEGYLIGLLLGDGTITKTKAVISVWSAAPGADEVMEAAAKAASVMPTRSDFRGWREVRPGEWVLVLGAVRRLAETLGLRQGVKTMTPAIERTSSRFYAGFLRGLFDADGSVQGTQAKGVSVRLAQSDIGTLEAVQRMLLRLGIGSRIYFERRPERQTLLPDGRGGSRNYVTRPQHELVISGENLDRFARGVGFADSAKAERLRRLLTQYRRRLNRERFVARVSSLVPDGEEDVFDVQVPGLNSFDANGFVVHNCGEQPLLPYESCNLGSINVARFARRTAGEAFSPPGGGVGEKALDPDFAVDWDGLGNTVSTAVRFLDDVIDMNLYPIPEIDRVTKLTRKIGLGVMGWADLLFELGLPYDSEEALELGERLMAFIREHADKASEALAAARGVFPAWQESTYGPAGANRCLRNSTRTTVAPTGTLSIIAGCSGGIEPAFALAFTRLHYLDPSQPAKPVKLAEVDQVFERAAHEGGFWSDGLARHLAEGGPLREREDVPDWAKEVFVTAHEVEPEWHVRMQAAFQRHTDNAVSKTINFPRDATVADVAAAYMQAYREECKGITIYRDGSRAGQVLSHAAKSDVDAESATEAGIRTQVAPEPGLHRRHMPEERRSITHKFRVGEQEGFVTVGLFEDGTPGEIFVTISKEGSTIRGLMDSVAMLTSYSLQYGVPLRTMVEKFRGVHFEPAGFTSNPEIPQASSIVDYIFRWLELKFLEGPKKNVAAAVRPPGAVSVPPAPPNPSSKDIGTGLLCPDCGSQLVFTEGCLLCRGCGYTKCG